MYEIVRTENLWKVYPDGTKALKGINLSIMRGEFVGVMGPSGSGKSTLLHLIGGLDKPTEGKVLLFGKDIVSMGEDDLSLFRRGKVAYIFQFYYLLEDFNVLENLLLIGEILGIEDLQKKALEILDFLRLSHRLKHKPHQLSGGEQQRVAIGRALMGEPALVLADEPTGNIDWEESMKIMGLFEKLNKEKEITFVVATHNPRLKKFFRRTLNLNDGVLVGEGAPSLS